MVGISSGLYLADGSDSLDLKRIRVEKKKITTRPIRNYGFESDPDPRANIDAFITGSTTLDLFGYLWLELVQD